MVPKGRSLRTWAHTVKSSGVPVWSMLVSTQTERYSAVVPNAFMFLQWCPPGVLAQNLGAYG